MPDRPSEQQFVVGLRGGERWGARRGLSGEGRVERRPVTPGPSPGSWPRPLGGGLRRLLARWRGGRAWCDDGARRHALRPHPPEGGRGRGRSVSRVLCPPADRRRWPSISDAGCPAPPATATRGLGGLPASALLFGLAPDGVCLAGRSPGRRWALTPPFHPYRPARPAVSFLWHFPSGHPDWALPSVLPCGARTFLTTARRRWSGHPTASTTADSTPGRRPFLPCWPPSRARRSPGWRGRRRPGSAPAGRGLPTSLESGPAAAAPRGAAAEGRCS
jgi:hypothetical protein